VNWRRREPLETLASVISRIRTGRTGSPAELDRRIRNGVLFMPWSAPHPCGRPLCPGRAESGQRFCIEHRKPVYRKVDGYRVTRAERVFNAVWREFSASYLARPENELCVDCGQPANDVYYSIRAEFRQPVTIREENCAAVCSACCKLRECSRY
jgi:hypothetical protein